MEQDEKTGIIFNIQKFAVHDGPGIRTTVFMKGCPLKCRWCSNAESMSTEAELGIIRSLCNSCGRCLEVCSEDAISFNDDNAIRFDREKCTACGQCVTVCNPGALTIYGRQVTVEDVFREISRDRAFYEGSGGGVTVSGGEPLRQADFVAELFRKCRREGINTCLDTCGYAATDKLKEVLDFTDYVLYDIKHMDTDLHRQFTGAANDIILTNARVVAESVTPVLYRIPLVKDVNDTENNIAETAKFIRATGKDKGVELLPYHRLGIGKYRTLDRDYPGETLTTPPPEDIESVRQIFEEHGVNCQIGG